MVERLRAVTTSVASAVTAVSIAAIRPFPTPPPCPLWLALVCVRLKLGQCLLGSFGLAVLERGLVDVALLEEVEEGVASLAQRPGVPHLEREEPVAHVLSRKADSAIENLEEAMDLVMLVQWSMRQLAR